MANNRSDIDQDEEGKRIVTSSYRVLEHLTKVIAVMEKSGYSKTPPKTGKVGRPLSPTKKQKHHHATKLHLSYLNTKTKIEKLKGIIDEMEAQDGKKKKKKKSPAAGEGHKESHVPKLPSLQATCEDDVD
ncbi:unnamed protein product [Clonostachys rosea]|uniref:Uncharacterized protein n=1 Tax=Bionectria ochroleuca TaxID=29856 RepID=A0ABY6UAQ5_BIOOC|nr:unnamed protein product [Clonostachys rosea]